MSNAPDKTPLRQTILGKNKAYSKKAGRLGYRARELVFGFRLPAKPYIDLRSLPARLDQHRILQRRRVFKQAGGDRSSIALHALKKARHSSHRG